MSRTDRVFLLGMLGWLLCSLSGLAAAGASESEWIRLAARDSLTGAPVEAVVELADDSDRLLVTGALQQLGPLSVAVQARASAPGYAPLEFELRPGDSMTLLLDPLEEPAPYAQLLARSEDASGRWLSGYVRRAEDGAALAGARVEMEGQQVISDADGYFELQLPPCSDETSHTSILHIDAGTDGQQTVDEILCAPGVSLRVIALQAGQSLNVSESTGALDRLAGDFSEGFSLPWEAAERSLEPLFTPEGVMVADPIAPPSSLRVGFADAACTQTCCVGSCGHTCTKSLETYVRHGLHREWIASWNQQSLRSGSIAYRSYGAWHVDNPRSSTYDLCSNACCQVNGNTTHSAADQAAARTPGIVLTRDGATPFRSEYSAENNSWKDPNSTLSCTNNDLSCGDGYAGSPATNWPCLTDPVSSGKSCFGHGRGMSQWGTQRWALHSSTPTWRWIADHYFNDNNNANGQGTGLRTAKLTSPLTLTAAAASPATALPGSTIQLQAQAGNLASANHAYLLIGASLYRSGIGYIDDPANDSPISLASGTHAIARDFVIPAGTPPGSYDVLVSLYLDVNENGQISSADLPMALITATAALEVLALEDEMFDDRFEEQGSGP